MTQVHRLMHFAFSVMTKFITCVSVSLHLSELQYPAIKNKRGQSITVFP
jgi:hypothetical protein